MVPFTISMSANEERAFYDQRYAAFLELPDHAVAVDRQTMLATWADPEQPAYERRRIYERALGRLLAEGLEGREVLDYGCGPGDWGVWMATEGASVTLLDLSPVAIDVGLRRAHASGVADLVRGEARDASDLGCFRNGQFDLIFACAALHHTLKYPGALDELCRVLRPGGVLLLVETFGNNPFLNGARKLRAWLAREPAEQGEEIVISERELALLRTRFERVEAEPMHLLTMSKRLLRGHFTIPAARWFLGMSEALDGFLLRLWPGLGKYCGEVLIVARGGTEEVG